MGHRVSSPTSNQHHKRTMPGSRGDAATTYVRRAHHAGSWYSNRRQELADTLQEFLSRVNLPSNLVSELTGPVVVPGQQDEQDPSPARTRRLRAIVCPHAGYSYSGPTAAYSYQALWIELSTCSSSSSNTTIATATATTQNSLEITTLVVLHPSHHVYLKGCAVSGASVLQTPVGNLKVPGDLRDELLQLSAKNARLFTVMQREEDEHEHSGEMQYPFIAYVLKQLGLLDRIQVLPIMCGALSVAQETQYGQVLAPILNRPNVLTVVSTDFCHWGSRFQYQPGVGSNTSRMPIHEYITQLDRRGMDLIAAQRPGAFADYIQETHNTICGRHAVAVWLRAMEASRTNAGGGASIEFVKYAQSSAVTSTQESSVSYAAALATEPVESRA